MVILFAKILNPKDCFLKLSSSRDTTMWYKQHHLIMIFYLMRIHNLFLWISVIWIHSYVAYLGSIQNVWDKCLFLFSNKTHIIRSTMKHDMHFNNKKNSSLRYGTMNFNTGSFRISLPLWPNKKTLIFFV